MLVVAAPVVQAGECQDGAIAGEMTAARQPTPGALAGGILGGLILSFLGTGLAAGASAIDAPYPPPHLYPEDQSKEYQRCFVDSYQRTLRRKRVRQAALGGLPGSILWVVYAATY